MTSPWDCGSISVAPAVPPKLRGSLWSPSPDDRADDDDSEDGGQAMGEKAKNERAPDDQTEEDESPDEEPAVVQVATKTATEVAKETAARESARTATQAAKKTAARVDRALVGQQNRGCQAIPGLGIRSCGSDTLFPHEA